MATESPYFFALTDEEWENIEFCISPVRHHTYARRDIVNAILFVQNSGCHWQDLPSDLPPWKTVYAYYRLWRKNGTWKKIARILEKNQN